MYQTKKYNEREPEKQVRNKPKAVPEDNIIFDNAPPGRLIPDEYCPKNWYPGKKFCPYTGEACNNFRCVAWDSELNYCTVFERP